MDIIKYNGRSLALGQFSTDILCDGRKGIFECKLVGRVGEGAEARVYHTKDVFIAGRKVKRACVLKIVNNTKLDRVVIAHLLRMTHANVEQIYAFSTGITDSFLLSEKLDKTVQTSIGYLRSKGVEWLKNNFIRDCLNGLNFLHNKLYIIHCDIKEDNIMFSSGTFKLIDFNNSQMSANKGKVAVDVTVLKKPPSLYENMRQWDERLDYWALGCVLYNISAGVHLLYRVRDEYMETVLVSDARWNVQSLTNAYALFMNNNDVADELDVLVKRIMQLNNVTEFYTHT